MTSNISDARRITAGGIKYKLLEGYPKIDHSDEGTSAEEQYLIHAQNLRAFIYESMPPAVAIGGFISRPPRRRMPGTGFLATVSVAAEPHSGQLPADPFGADTGAPDNTYDPLLRVTIKYETMQEEEDEDQGTGDPETFLEHSISAGAQMLTIPPRKLKFLEISPGDLQPDEIEEYNAQLAEFKQNKDMQLALVHTIPTIEHQLKWKLVRYPPWKTIFRTLGRCNNQSIKLFFDAHVETVLFMGISGSRRYLWDGEQTRISYWELDYKFSQRYIYTGTIGNESDADDPAGKHAGWNHVFAPDKRKWVRVIFDDSGTTIHERADFNKLFKAGAEATA